MASWEEIKKLAADLHRVQLGDSAKKLSERNCIEIVAGLIEKCLIDVVFSLDGKEYVTRDYLRTQIVNETLTNDGQLITRDYFDKVFKEIDERLQDFGRLTLSDITKCYELPTDLLVEEIVGQLGNKIKATIDSVDSSVLYTTAYVEFQRALLAGALLAITKPIQVCKIINELGLERGLFFSSFDSLSSTGEIRGFLSGGKILERAVFIPDIYVESVERFIKNFYYQNAYVEVADVKKITSSAPVSWLQTFLGVEPNTLLLLKTVVISREIYDQIESNAEQKIKKQSWVDISTCLPFPMPEQDLNDLVEIMRKKYCKEWHLSRNTLFYTGYLVDSCVRLFEPIINERASQESSNIGKLLRISANHSSAFASKETSSNADGKKGRNLTEKSRNKKRNPEAFSKVEEMTSPHDFVQFMTHEQLVTYLNEQLQMSSCPTDLLDDVCEKISGVLNAKFKGKLESIYLNTQSSSMKKSHSEFTEKFCVLYQNICLFDAGTEIFSGTISEQLKSHLLRTLCSDLVNLMVSFYGSVPNASHITQKIRDSTIESFESSAKHAFVNLIASLSNKHLEAFYDAVDEVLSPSICSLNVKRPDKKSRAELIGRYQKELLEQLTNCKDLSVGLLLSCLLLVTKYHPDVMIHASGKFVPQMVAALQENAPQKLRVLLLESQNNFLLHPWKDLCSYLQLIA